MSSPQPQTYPNFFNGGYYIPPIGAEALRNFQYSGVDLSPIYKYILSPLAQCLVDTITPTTVAPNTITMFGLTWMITSYLIMCFYCPDIDNALVAERNGTDFPKWIFLFNCIAMLVYQTLDNMDGKQARKTKSSSALGLLFDHGCDAFNIVLGATNWMCVMGLNPVQDGRLCYFIALIPTLPFFVGTWEEYHTGKLVLPFFNGPTEGLLLGASLSAISFVMGVEFWQGTDFYDLVFGKIFHLLPSAVEESFKLVLGCTMENTMRNCEIIVMLSVVILSQEFISKVIFVVRNHGIKSLRNIIPFLTLAIVGGFVCHNHAEIFQRHTRLCLNLGAALFVDMVTQLMLDHMTVQPFNPYRLALMPLVLFFFIATGMEETDKDAYVWSYTASMTVYLSMKMHVVISEICSCLGIWCFDIETPYRYPTTEKTPSEVGNGVLANGNGSATTKYQSM